MNKLKKILCLVGTLLLILTAGFYLPIFALAADEVYRMMHGEQDALIVGTIEQVTEEGYLTTVSHVISCKKDTSLNRQLPAEQVPEQLLIEDIRYRYSYHGKSEPEAGDAIVISLDCIEENVWQQVWLALEVSTTDINSLAIMPEEKLTADTYAWQMFIDSGGEISEFSYDSTSLYVDGEMVFDEIDHLIKLRKEMQPKGENSISIAGGADGPTSIFVAGKIDDSAMTTVPVYGAMIIIFLAAVIIAVCRMKKRGKNL